MPSSAPEKWVAVLRRFAESLADNFAAAVPAQPEDQLKAPVQSLLREAGSLFGLRVESRTEARVPDLAGRPDLGVSVGGLLAGHVELKAPGKGARTERLRGADRDQWKKFQALPNLLYTDGLEWALYRSGQRQGDALQLGTELLDLGPAALDSVAAEALSRLLRDFLFWEPAAPTSPRALAELLAPLCRLLRDDVVAALGESGSTVGRLAGEWREVLFPEADDAQFADAYAQTLTYTLLLARFEGAERITADLASQALQRRHGLLARVLQILSLPEVRREIGFGIELLERVIGAIDEPALRRKGDDPWIYFYEDFLAAYDPRLRKDRGVYYTPPEVIQAQCRLVAQLLIERFGKRLAFADEGVVVLDPGAGTGAYLRAALGQSLELVRESYGPGAVAGRASQLAENLHGFEILVGPYAVAHLRLTQGILDHGGELPEDGVHVYLTDTLESPRAEPERPQLRLSCMYEPLAEEHRRAREVKAEKRVLVCFGNPPYDRQQLALEDQEGKRKGGWVRWGGRGERPILEDFLAPVREAGQGVHLKNLYNDYVYFWRWALWKVFETGGEEGIVSFITASSYLRGPGFAGMRQFMRETFDELWILDLEGDSLGPRKTENVFAIRIPVAIAVGVRQRKPRRRTPARVHYAKLTGPREAKLARLGEIHSLKDIRWKRCFPGWTQPFLPEAAGDYFSWPLLVDLFPWQHSGVQFKRTWPIGETRTLLEHRWQRLLATPGLERGRLFRETEARRVTAIVADVWDERRLLKPIAQLTASDPAPRPERYAYRSFDRQWALLDPRLADRIRPVLMHSRAEEQVYLTSLLSGVLGSGPAATVAAQVPDLHHFRGSFGARDVVPLYRDGSTMSPNVANGLLSVLSRTVKLRIGPEDLFAYAYALLASPAFVERFSEELSIPGLRSPITKDRLAFRRGARLGGRLIFLHTFGERFVPKGERAGAIPRGRARCSKAVPGSAARYPEEFSFDEEREALRVGDGEFGPVPASVWSFSVSGLEVLRSWLAYRMKRGAGKASSPLDEIRPERWTSEMTEELLRLLWILEATVDLFPALERNLDAVLDGEVFAAEELPQPTAEERRPSVIEGEAPAQNSIEFE